VTDVPITQAEEMYVALGKRGVPTTIARCPNEGHGFRRPTHIMDSIRRTDAWFDQYLR
jgi:dipeptidyl aminopeptidase/acylaminoacyl peptidase